MPEKNETRRTTRDDGRYLRQLLAIRIVTGIIASPRDKKQHPPKRHRAILDRCGKKGPMVRLALGAS